MSGVEQANQEYRAWKEAGRFSFYRWLVEHKRLSEQCDYQPTAQLCRNCQGTVEFGEGPLLCRACADKLFCEALKGE